MSPVVLGLVLTAAVAHATWNLLAKGAEGGAAFVWLCSVAGSVIYLPVLAVSLVLAPRGGDVGWLALGLMAGSGALHAAYFVLLQRGYAGGDLSLVYPLGRGTGVLLSTTVAIAALGERPSGLAVAGAAIIIAAVFSLAAGRTGAARHADRRGKVFALLTGVAIASYTLWDKHAVGPDGLAPITYYWGTNLANGLLMTPWIARHPDRLRRAWATSRRHAAGVGLLSPLAYVLVLYALAHAPVSYVAPARETSILFGTILGATVLGEGDRRRRLIAGAATVVGVA
ncbi:MAG TPA: DMT family transporter, partial [Solirubrobacteraceae bacterium]|nr:DMT family transporter [Solirubrobacteraceae bacterium]